MEKIRRGPVHPQVEFVEAMECIYCYRMTTTSGGNLSIKDAHCLFSIAYCLLLQLTTDNLPLTKKTEC